jgi:hypothetical protein
LSIVLKASSKGMEKLSVLRVESVKMGDRPKS